MDDRVSRVINRFLRLRLRLRLRLFVVSIDENKLIFQISIQKEMSNEKLLYEQKPVVIKERSTQSELRITPLDEVTGTLTLIENDRGKFFRFVPFGVEDVMTDDWALINGSHSVVFQKNETGPFESSLFFSS